MKSFIHEMNVQKNLTDQILINDNSIIKVGKCYIPVAIYECNRDRTEHKNIEIVFSDGDLTSAAKSDIKNATYTNFPQLTWSLNTSLSQEINTEFNKLVSASSKSARIKDLTLQLFNSTNYQSL